MKKVLYGFMVMLLCALGAQGGIKIASLHPLLSDMARQIGGDAVEVVDLFPENGELHAFEPTVVDVAAAAGAQLVLACGKGVEPYLDDLRDSLPERTRIVELGRTVPDVYLPGLCVADPHWWNSPTAMKRASRALRTTLEQLAPEQKATFAKGQRVYSNLMDTLTREARLAFSNIPQKNRVLVCSHAAMMHFCEAFDFSAIAVHGVAQESEGDTATLAQLLARLRSSTTPCLFYGVNESPRVLQTIARQAGASTRPLVLDGIYPEAPTYAAMFRFNIKNITEGLSTQ